MNLAIISINSPGKKLAREIKNQLDMDPTIFKVDLYHKNVKSTLNKIFKDYDAILGIMASGIMVRSLCELISDKTTDPAVMVMDEAGLNIISLLSGHLGGANNLTKKIANLMNINPVITTATDVNNILGIDELARKYLLEIEKPELILNFNKALLNGKSVYLSSSQSSHNIRYLFKDPTVEKNYVLKNTEHDKVSNKLTATGESFPNFAPIMASLNNENSIENLKMKPYLLVVGVGSRKGVIKSEILNALENTLEILDLPLDRINAIATAEIKKNEEGIVESAREINVPLKIVTLEQIKNFNSDQCSASDFVNEKFGINGVCEPSALISAGKNSKLIFKKTAYNGVTIAVAIGK